MAGSNGKKVEVTVSLNRDVNSKVEAIAEEQEVSVQSVIKTSVQHLVDATETKSVLRKVCLKGDIDSESKTCKILEFEDKNN